VLTREPYTLDGAPIVVEVPHFAHFVGEEVVRRPRAYAVPPEVGAHLERHGLKIERAASREPVAVEVAVVRGEVSSAGREILEANASSYLDAEYRKDIRVLPPDWVVVPTEQQRGAIAVYLCEAGSDDGLVACELIEKPRPGDEFPAWRIA
jgi:hypothetical protein